MVDADEQAGVASGSPARDSFASAVGSVAVATTPSGPVELRIAEVSPSRVTGSFESFSVLLVGPPERIEQATYPVAHPGLGELDLFIVPVGQEPGGILYEAVFNRRVDGAT